MFDADDRRRPRERVLLAAKIEFNKNQSVFDCFVKDLSGGGARLAMASTLGVPDLFTLCVPARNMRQPCRVVWCNEREAGVSFAVDKTGAVDKPGAPARLRPVF